MESSSSSDLDTQWLETLLKKYIHDMKIVKVLKLNEESAVAKGENYCSIVKRVTVRAMTASGSKKTYSIIVKLAITSEALGEYSSFRAETKLYATILKQMEALMDEFGDKRDYLWPKLYGYQPYSVMALEDLKDRNFVLVDRKAWQSLDHGLLVLRSLGRFHAMSKILIGRGLITEDEKGKNQAADCTPLIVSAFDGGIHMLSKAMINKLGYWPSGWEDMGRRLAKQKGVLCKKLEALSQHIDDKLEVLNHGDLWSSNMMFRELEYTGLPTQVIFLDFQLFHKNSLMWDVNYFMYTTIKPSIRRLHKDQLLTAYHQSLSDNLKFFQWPGYIPTLDDVIQEEKIMLPVALAFACVFQPILTSTSNEPFNVEKCRTHPPEEFFDMDAFSEEKFVRECGDDIKKFAELGIF